MGAEFDTTRWSWIEPAQQGADTDAAAALEAICRNYWYPLYAFVRRRGRDEDEARDLTQGYFAYLIENDLLQQVDRSRGRFRSFLLASLKHYISHQREKGQALKRGGRSRSFSIDSTVGESRYRYEPVDELTPEDVFERSWALTVVERTLCRLRDQAQRDGTAERFEKLEQYLTGEEPHTPYSETAKSLGMTEVAVRAAVRRLRQRFGVLMRKEIAVTVTDPSDADEELRYLLAAISPWEPHRS